MYDDTFNNFLDQTLDRPSISRTFANGFGLNALIAKRAFDPLFRRPETSVNRGDSILRASCLEGACKIDSNRIPSGVRERVFDLQATIRDLGIKTRKIDSRRIPSRDRVFDLQATIRDLGIKTRKIDSRRIPSGDHVFDLQATIRDLGIKTRKIDSNRIPSRVRERVFDLLATIRDIGIKTRKIDSRRIPSGARVFDLQATIRDLGISVRDQSKLRLDERGHHFLTGVPDELFLKSSLNRARLNAIFTASTARTRLIGRSSAFRSRTDRAGSDRSASGIDPRLTHMPEFP
jgi:hypothetical protein